MTDVIVEDDELANDTFTSNMKVPDELTKPKVEPIKEEELKVEMDAIPVPKLNLPPPESRLETDLITESDVIKGGFTPMN